MVASGVGHVIPRYSSAELLAGWLDPRKDLVGLDGLGRTIRHDCCLIRHAEVYINSMTYPHVRNLDLDTGTNLVTKWFFDCYRQWRPRFQILSKSAVDICGKATSA